MSDRQINETARVLIAAKKLISDPEKWCVGSLHNQDGKSCADGALNRIVNGGDGKYSPASRRLKYALDAAAIELFGPGAYSSQVNNTLGHAAVMQMFDKAIERALQEQEQSK